MQLYDMTPPGFSHLPEYSPTRSASVDGDSDSKSLHVEGQVDKEYR